MRIATWNVNSLKARLPRVEEWLEYAEPDVLCLQETKLSDKAFPAMTFSALGYDSVHYGQGQWNGVAILSRVGIADVTSGFGDLPDPYEGDARLLAATCNGVRVVSVYVPNGREVGTEHYERKLEWLAQLRTWLDTTASPNDAIAILGDFNVAPEDRDVWSVKAFEGATHVTEPERAAVRALEDWGMVDAFRARYDGDRPLHVLGLPPRRLPPAPGHAHRPRARDEAAGRAARVRARRPQRAARASNPLTTRRCSSTSPDDRRLKQRRTNGRRPRPGPRRRRPDRAAAQARSPPRVGSVSPPKSAPSTTATSVFFRVGSPTSFALVPTNGSSARALASAPFANRISVTATRPRSSLPVPAFTNPTSASCCATVCATPLRPEPLSTFTRTSLGATAGLGRLGSELAACAAGSARPRCGPGAARPGCSRGSAVDGKVTNSSELVSSGFTWRNAETRSSASRVSKHLVDPQVVDDVAREVARLERVAEALRDHDRPRAGAGSPAGGRCARGPGAGPPPCVRSSALRYLRWRDRTHDERLGAVEVVAPGLHGDEAGELVDRGPVDVDRHAAERVDDLART